MKKVATNQIHKLIKQLALYLLCSIMVACKIPLTEESREDDEIRRVHEQYLGIFNDQATDNLHDKCSRLYDIADKPIIDRALIVSRHMRYATSVREIMSSYKGPNEIHAVSSYLVPKFNSSVQPSVPTKQAFIQGCIMPGFFFQISRHAKQLKFEKIIHHHNQYPLVLSQGDGLSTYTWYRKEDGRWKFIKTKITSNFYASSISESDNTIGEIFGISRVMSEIQKLCPQQFTGLITEENVLDLVSYHFGPEANGHSWRHARDNLYYEYTKAGDGSIKKIHETYQKAGGCPGNAGRYLTIVMEMKTATEMSRQFMKLDALAYSQ